MAEAMASLGQAILEATRSPAAVGGAIALVTAGGEPDVAAGAGAK